MHSKEIVITTFDLFDTLITRCYFNPKDLFRELGSEVYNTLGIKNFSDLRISLEEDLRKTSSLEIKFDQIYKKIQEKLQLSDKQIDHIKKRELELEFSSYEPVFKNLEKLKKEKIKIIISDTYFNKDFINEIVNKILKIKVDHLFISSELGVTKSNGKMYQYVRKELNIKFSNWFHIGDNIQSDYNIPKKIGIKPTLFNDLTSISWKNSVEPSTIDESKFFGELSNFLNSEEFEPHEIYFAKTFLPLMFKMIHQIRNFQLKNNFTQILFLSRDGYLFYILYKIMFGGERIKYIYSSRKILLPLASLNKSEFDLEYYLKNMKADNIYMFFTGLSFELKSNHLNILANQNLSLKKKLNSSDKKKFKNILVSEPIFYDQILKHLLKSKELYINYFADPRVTENSKVLIFDLGWHGNMQRYLQRILVENKIKIYGYYFDLLTNIENSSKFLKDKNTLSHIYSVSLLEYFFTSYHGSVNWIKEKNGQAYFTFKPVTSEYKSLISKYEQILNGFTSRLIDKDLISSNLSYSLVKSNLIFNNMLPPKNFIETVEKNNLTDDLYGRSNLLIQRIGLKGLLKIIIKRNFSGITWPYGSFAISFKNYYYLLIKYLIKLKVWEK